MRIALGIAFAAVVAGSTALLGWWSVPLLGGVWGLFRGPPLRAGAEAAVAAALGWALLMAITALQGPVWYLAGTLGGIFQVPGPLVLALALIYPAVLAGAAAALTAALRALVGGRKETVAGN